MIYLIDISLHNKDDGETHTYEGKHVIPTKTAMYELDRIDVTLHEAITILHHGFIVRKRKKNTIEKGAMRGSKIINIVAVNSGTHYKIIHAGTFTYTKKFKDKVHHES